MPTAAAVVLNITPDHLDVHGDLAAYQMAKARIYARCDVALVNRDVPLLGRWCHPAHPRWGLVWECQWVRILACVRKGTVSGLPEVENSSCR